KMFGPMDSLKDSCNDIGGDPVREGTACLRGDIFSISQVREKNQSWQKTVANEKFCFIAIEIHCFLKADSSFMILHASKNLGIMGANTVVKSGKGHFVSPNQPKNLEGYVGFANLPNQVYRKSVKRGFEFTLMVVGESGLGKSTLINSLFLTDLYSPEYPGPSHRIKKTVQVEQAKVLIKEGGVQLLLTIVDTPGFGDAVDNSNCWQPVIDYIDSKFEDYLNAESRVNRRQMPDNRVQCCLYFIAPSGHGLKPLDIEFMKRLHEKVNIIPLIAKADTLTPEECQQFKKQIMKEIQEHKIKIYEFPETDDEEENKLVKKIKLPVISNTWYRAFTKSGSPLAQMEEERREHVAKMKKMEMEMEQVFEMKVKEKVQKLKDSEAELQRRHEQMKKNLEAQHKELEEKRRQFEEEKANWEAQQRILEQQNSSRIAGKSTEKLDTKEKKQGTKKTGAIRLL
ncbi:septin-7, partial [Cricetulus griseus]